MPASSQSLTRTHLSLHGSFGAPRGILAAQTPRVRLFFWKELVRNAVMRHSQKEKKGNKCIYPARVCWCGTVRAVLRSTGVPVIPEERDPKIAALGKTSEIIGPKFVKPQVLEVLA